MFMRLCLHKIKVNWYRIVFFLRRAVRKRSPSRDYFCLAFVAALAYFESFAHISLFHACQVVTFTKRIKMSVWFWIFLDQICPKWIKMDPTWSNLIKLDQTLWNWISHQSKNVTTKSCHIYKKNNNGCFIWIFLDQICPKLIKLDQTWSNLIKLDQN